MSNIHELTPKGDSPQDPPRVLPPEVAGETAKRLARDGESLIGRAKDIFAEKPGYVGLRLGEDSVIRYNGFLGEKVFIEADDIPLKTGMVQLVGYYPEVDEDTASIVDLKGTSLRQIREELGVDPRTFLRFSVGMRKVRPEDKNTYYFFDKEGNFAKVEKPFQLLDEHETWDRPEMTEEDFQTAEAALRLLDEELQKRENREKEPS